METACPQCGALVQQRIWASRHKDPALFVETYTCGAIRAWGLVIVENDAIGQALRECVEPKKKDA